ncbi:MAG TPA: AMP-binding protein [Terriglobales bacterium]
MARTLVDHLGKFLELGDEIAYVQPHGYRAVRWSYRRVAQMAFRLARELEARGIAKGDRVFLWGPNSAEWVSVFWGCALRGAIVVPMDEAASDDFARRVYEQVGAKLVVCSGKHVEFAGSILRLEHLPEAVSGRSSERYIPAEVSSDDPLEIVFTSGTTADPKGVVITHANVLANLAPLEAEIQKYMKYECLVHPVRFLNLLPLSHVFGQFLAMFLPPLIGGTVIFEETLKPADILATIRRERVSVLVAVPRVLQSLKEKIERDVEAEGSGKEFARLFKSSPGKHFLRRWWIFRRIHRRFGWKFWAFISGGAALDRETEEFWGRLGYAVIQGYGLTETTSIVSVNHPFRLGKGSIGKVLAGREVKLADDGEILVRGGGVAAGYWSGDRLQPVASDGGWYGTGDVGELDAAGNLYFKGRKKEVIVTPAGMNVYPGDLEAALRGQPGVKDAVVVAVDRGGNAEPCAVMILRDGARAEEVVERANAGLAEYQRMNRWQVWPDADFPRTSTQKPKRNVIQLAVTESLSGHGAAATPMAELIERITGRTAQVSEGSNLEGDLRLSSLDRVALLSALEDRYQVELSESRFAAATTVRDLQGMIAGNAPARAQYHFPRWTQHWPVTWIRLASNYLLLRPAVFLLGWPRIEGRENLCGVSGPLLIVCNHVTDIDVGFVMAALPHRLGNRLATATGGEALEALRAPAKSLKVLVRVYDRVRWALGVALLNLFPLPREAGFRSSFRFAGETVDRGYNILVFPEGRVTEDGATRPFRGGVGLLTVNLGLPVVPMRIDGLFELKRAGKKFARPRQIRVRIGRPVKFAPNTAPDSIARELEKRVAEL